MTLLLSFSPPAVVILRGSSMVSTARPSSLGMPCSSWPSLLLVVLVASFKNLLLLPRILNLGITLTYMAFKIYEESECNFVNMDTVVKMAGLVNGGDDAKFETPVKVNGFYVYEPVDPNLPGRRGELNRTKIATRNASQALLMWLKNNMKYESWRSVQLRCRDKRFRCIRTNQIIECGEIWLKELTLSVVPSTLMRGLGFKVEFDNYSFDKAGLNPAVYFDHQDEMQDKANITMGPNTITDQRYVEKTWLDLDKEDPIENVPLFSHAVMIGKNEWANSTPETAKSKQEIVGELLNVYRNHVAEKAWNPVVRSTAEKARLVAFTAKVEQETREE
eukprot:scaffold134179_cov117-Cyclotella_meneghiniana.AAC.1